MIKKHRLWLTILCLCTWSAAKTENHLLFFEEHIDFTLDSTYFTINGIFSFRNTDDIEETQQIRFPFADKITTIDSIRIVNLNYGKTLAFKSLESSVLLYLTVPAKETVDINIYYRQKTATINRYIITSTQSWKKPLETAAYTLTTDRNQTIPSFSYTPDSIAETNYNRLYYRLR